MDIIDTIKRWFTKKPRQTTEESIERIITNRGTYELTPDAELRPIDEPAKEFTITEPQAPEPQPKFTQQTRRQAVEQTIDTKQKTFASQRITSNSTIPANSTLYTEQLKQLLEGKVTDERLREDIIKNADILVKKRVVAKITLQGDDVSASFDVIGWLPEYAQDAQSFWQGRNIRYFNDEVGEFGNEMKRKKGSLATIINEQPTKKSWKVNSIAIEMNFK